MQVVLFFIGEKMKAIRELEVGDICNNTLVYVGTAYRKKNLFDTLYQKDIENGVNIIFVDVLHINEDWFALGTFITYDLVSHSYAEFETEENESYKKKSKRKFIKDKDVAWKGFGNYR